MSKKRKKQSAIITPDAAIKHKNPVGRLVLFAAVLLILGLLLFSLASGVSHKTFKGVFSANGQSALLQGNAYEKPANSEITKNVLVNDAEFVDNLQCESCHVEQFRQWQTSHHHLAMQDVNEKTVLGDFNNIVFADDKERSRFFRKDNAFWINTIGADGKVADFKVAYTFGIEPLQQYLLELPGGRLQSFNVAWDTQKKRWFHLYPKQNMDFTSPLHWSKPAQNANFMCVECHTTGFKRNFNADNNTFASHWQELGVGCQSCHEPASQHVQWANNNNTKTLATVHSDNKGFAKLLNHSDNKIQVETCAQCHALRSPLGDGHQVNHQFMDDYLPSILTAEQYELDGKIKGEVFEYGSLAQSKMFAKGVRCSDCHNPHSGELRAEGNAVCTQCHNPVAKAIRPEIDARGLLPKNYDSPEHTHHAQGSVGAQCIACHMPGKFYMGNDFRHDHSFSTPNPSQALTLKTPDACLGCHKNDAAKNTQAVLLEAFSKWFPQAGQRDGGYAAALKRVRDGGEGAAKALQQQLARNDLPAIRRATLLAEAINYPSQVIFESVAASLKHDSPQVRETAIDVIAVLAEPDQQVQLLIPLLNDPLRAVRLAATWQLAQLPADLRQTISPDRWQRALDEYEQVQLLLASRGEANQNLASLYQLTGRGDKIEPALRAALQRDPDFLPALVSLTEWLDAQGRFAESGLMLSEAMQKHTKDALLPYAYGMSLIRQGKKEQALTMLAKSATLDPDDSQYRYVYAIALHDTGNAVDARKELQQLLAQQPENRAARMALFDYAREVRDIELMQQLLADLYMLNPDDPVLSQNRAR